MAKEEIVSPERTLVLCDDISQESISTMIEGIVKVNEFDNYHEYLAKSKKKKYDREPIRVYISTFGGDVYSGLALIDVFNFSMTPIITIGLGKIMSMGLPILVSGHYRAAGPNCVFHFHPISSIKQGMPEQLKVEVKQNTDLQNNITKLLLSETQIPKTKLKELVHTNGELYFNAETAKRWKVIDEISNIQAGRTFVSTYEKMT